MDFQGQSKSHLPFPPLYSQTPYGLLLKPKAFSLSKTHCTEIAFWLNGSWPPLCASIPLDALRGRITSVYVPRLQIQQARPSVFTELPQIRGLHVDIVPISTLRAALQ